LEILIYIIVGTITLYFFFKLSIKNFQTKKSSKKKEGVDDTASSSSPFDGDSSSGL